VVCMLLLAGCGIDPTGAVDEGDAPTGIATGTTLYFIDASGELVPEQRDNGRLGTIAEAVGLLLTGPGRDTELRTDIEPTAVTRVEVTTSDDSIALRLPLMEAEAPGRGVDQIVCTALATHVQSGGSADATVRLDFTIAAPGADEPRTCPLIG
jgi:hypothetical protein